MSEEKKNDALAVKLSLNKETLRIIDDSQLELLEEAVGGCNVTGNCGQTTSRLKEDPHNKDGQI